MKDQPYSKIPNSPNTYSSGKVVSKFLDGLGYRYFWATEGLHEQDLIYKISDGSRNIFELLVHLCDLSEGVVKVATHQVIVPPYDFSNFSFDELREKTINNIESSSNIFKTHTDNDLSDFKLIMESDGTRLAFPLWNVVVGPITDIGYHIGQVVALRRASGNPIHPNVNPFIGYTKM